MLNMLEKICQYHGKVNFDDDDPVAISICDVAIDANRLFLDSNVISRT